MRQTTSALGLVLMAKLNWAQTDPQCRGDKAPNWGDCEAIIDYNEFAGSDEVAHSIDETECKWWYWDEEGGNCMITHCWGEFQTGADYEGWNVTGEDINYWTSYVKHECEPFRAGGLTELMAPLEDADQGKIPETFEVFNDPEKRGKTKRALGINARSTKGPLTGGLSREAYNEFLNDTTSGGFARRRLSRRDDDGEDIEEMSISKTAKNIRNADEYDLGPRLSSGEYTYESTEGTTFSVTTSASIGAAWNIFTASAGIDTSQEDSWEISESIKFEVDCKNQGQVTFYPYYDYYKMYVNPGMYYVDVWVPVVTGGLVTGEIEVACTG